MADQTAQATKEIEIQVGTTQASTEHTVDVISHVSDTIGKMSGIATGISAAMKEQSAAMEEIVRSTQGGCRQNK